MSARLFCFGLGYTARALGSALRRQGFQVAGTCRDPESASRLREEGFEVALFDTGRPLGDATAALSGVTHLLSSVPPDAAGDPVLRTHGRDIAELAGALRWAGYLSTTGVYGDRQGGWVDEGSEVSPSGERGLRRAAAEADWLDLWWDGGLPVHVFRLAGIYGPGRSAIDQVRAGRARRIVKPDQVFSRIHVDDIVATLIASMERPRPGAVYNVCDDEAAPPQDVVAYACELLHAPPPPLVPFEDAGLSEMGRSFFDDNKRVRNDRIKDELGVRLRYPDYRSGLRAILEAEG
ncbi:MAG: SDR family oxidoreductase [Alphaproteobacteria bacterium]